MPEGRLITFEGVEGAGKSTQVRLLAAALRRHGREVVETREPGGTPLGEELRAIVKHHPGDLAPAAELLIFAACRAQLVEHLIRPALERDAIVLCDRFADSTTVYQGLARGLDLAFIQLLHEFTLGNDCVPALTLLLDLPAEGGLARAAARGGVAADRFEAEGAAFHTAIRDGFLTLAKAEPNRFRVIPADLPPEEVHRRILPEVFHALG